MEQPGQPTTQPPATASSERGEWWREWVLHHVELFGKQAQPDWYATLLKWKMLFVPGHTKDEMYAASRRLAAQPPKGFMDEHLAALEDALRTSKQRQISKAEAMARQDRLDANRCKYCLNTGWVTVPHLRSLDNGEWLPLTLTSSGAEVYYTMAVCCACYFGQKAKASNPGAMLLTDLDALCPNWLRYVTAARKEQGMKAGQAREGKARTRLDDTLDRMTRALGEGKFKSQMQEREGEDY